MGFKESAIKIEREKEFGELRAALSRIFAPEKMGQFLKLLQTKGVRIRDFDLVLASGALEQLDEELANSSKTARKLYQELTTSDQGQMREFYLSEIEEVEPLLRARFQKLYRYY